MVILKKYAIVFMLLAIAHNVYTMELEKTSYNPTDEQCMRIACYMKRTENEKKYDHERKGRCELLCSDHDAAKKVQKHYDALSFLCSIPDMRVDKFHENIEKMKEQNKPVHELSIKLSESNMFVFVSYNADFITEIFMQNLPDSFDDRAGFFNPAFNQGVQSATASKKQENKVDKKVTKNQMIAALRTMPLVKVLYGLRYVDLPPSVSSQPRYDLQEINDSIAKIPARTTRKDGYESYWSFEDCEKYTDTQRFLLDSIVNSDGSCLITDEHVETMKFQKPGLANGDTIKNYVLSNQKYNDALVQVELDKPTMKERIKDRLILLVPYGLAMIAPDLILSQTDGMAQGAAGILACSLGCAAFGEYFYPEIDAYNSKVSRLSPWFGADNHCKKKRGTNFFQVNLVHALSSIVGQKLLSWQKMPWKITGGIIYCLRVLLAWGQLDVEERVCARRTNKFGLPFTMQDLMNGPKFAEKE